MGKWTQIIEHFKDKNIRQRNINYTQQFAKNKFSSKKRKYFL